MQSTNKQNKIVLLKGESAPFNGVLFSEEKVKELRKLKFELNLEKDLRQTVLHDGIIYNSNMYK
jgi:hypothetical protein